MLYHLGNQLLSMRSVFYWPVGMNRKERNMKTNSVDAKKIRLDIILFCNAFIAALISLTTASAIAAGIAKGLSYIFLSLFLIAVIDNILQRIEA